MAKKYGFKYELVQYKWPRWLYQQTEKQRIIWGYKILFLDVLFPLAVDKIIFVDADQVRKNNGILTVWGINLDLNWSSFILCGHFIQMLVSKDTNRTSGVAERKCKNFTCL